MFVASSVPVAVTVLLIDPFSALTVSKTYSTFPFALSTNTALVIIKIITATINIVLFSIFHFTHSFIIFYSFDKQ